MKKLLLTLCLLAALITGCAGTNAPNANSQDLTQQEIGSKPTPQTKDTASITNTATITATTQPTASANESIHEKEYTPPEMKGEITISTMEEWDFMTEGARMFMEKYPDVKVTIDAFRNVETIKFADGSEMSGTPTEEFSTQNYWNLLNTKIMTGKAEDIIMTDPIPLSKYIQMGAFEDLSFYLDHSPEISDESHYMKAFDIMRDTNGSLYEIPLTWNPQTIIFFDKQLVESANLPLDGSIQSMSYTEALEYAKRLADSTNMPNTFLEIGNSGLHTAYNIMSDNLLDFIDPKNKKSDFDNERFINILRYAKGLEDSGYYDTNGTIDFYNMEYHFAMGYDFGTQAAYYALYPDASWYHPMPVSDALGNIEANAFPCFAINSASESKELSWEFLKFLLSDEFQISPSLFGLGVNKKGFDACVERNLKLYNGGGQTNVSKEDYEGLLRKWISQINSYKNSDPVSDPAIGNVFIFPEMLKFFDGEQTAEDTARILQSKLDKYLNE